MVRMVGPTAKFSGPQQHLHPRARRSYPAYRLAHIVLAVTIIVGLMLNGEQVAAGESSDPTTSESMTSLGGPGEVLVLSSTDEALTLALTTPDFEVQSSTDDLGACVAVEVPGYLSGSVIGAPRLPSKAALVGVPENADISLAVISLVSETWDPPARVCRVTPPEIAWAEREDAGILIGQPGRLSIEVQQNDQLLSEPAVLGDVSIIRSRRVTTVRFNPLQIDSATGGLRYNRRIVVKVTFDHDLARGVRTSLRAPVADSPAFERLLSNLVVNYPAARTWPTAAQALGPKPERNLAQTLSTDAAPLYRITVEEPGLYEVTYSDLVAADPGISTTDIVTSQIRVSNQSQDIAIEILNDIDGVFGPGDTILFYGEAIGSKYTDQNIYWLTWDNGTPPRMMVRDVTPDGDPSSQYFTDTLRLEENHWYWTETPEVGTDHWYWDYLRPGLYKTVHEFELSDLANAPMTATLRGLVAGYKVDTQHSIELVLNDQTVLTATWANGTDYPFEVALPASSLKEGTNALSVTGGLVSAKDYVLTNWFELDYGREYVASNDRLAFSTEGGGRTYTITGFGTDAIDVLDLTNPKHPGRVINYDVTAIAETYAVSFQDMDLASRDYRLSAVAQRRSPVAIERAALRELRNLDGGADYIIITHGDFYTATQPLADYHTQNGLRVVTVDVDDIYDVFSAGIVDPEGIRSFLTYAYANWTPPAPTYVLLVGDGNRDPLNYQEKGEISFIPPYLGDIDPFMGETAADNRYVSIDGVDDRLPDMHLGRLPVKTVAEAQAMVQKIMTYAQDPSPSDWHRRVLFVSDDYPDSAGDFYAYSDAVADHLVPLPYLVEKAYYLNTHDTVAATRYAITSTINEGTLITNYVGHGGKRVWADEALLTPADVVKLDNTGRLPFVVPMTCLEGYYLDPSTAASDQSSIAETFVRLPTAGAIASWSPTGLGLATGHDYLHQGLYKALFQEDIPELGPATTYAKLYLAQTESYLDLLDTYLLFGDPATELQVLPIDLEIETEVAGGQARFDAGDAVTYTLTYSNAGPATAHNVEISATLPAALVPMGWVTSGSQVISQTGTTYAWDVVDLSAGAGGVITVTGTIDAAYGGDLVSTAEILSTSREEATANNTTSVSVWVASDHVYLPLVIRGSS